MDVQVPDADRLGRIDPHPGGKRRIALLPRTLDKRIGSRAAATVARLINTDSLASVGNIISRLGTMSASLGMGGLAKMTMTESSSQSTRSFSRARAALSPTMTESNGSNMTRLRNLSTCRRIVESGNRAHCVVDFQFSYRAGLGVQSASGPTRELI